MMFHTHMPEPDTYARSLINKLKDEISNMKTRILKIERQMNIQNTPRVDDCKCKTLGLKSQAQITNFEKYAAIRRGKLNSK